MKTVDGIELLRMIKNGEVKAGTEIKEYYMGLPTKHKMKVTEDNLVWKPGEFYVGELWNDNYKFEIIEEEKEIEELPKTCVYHQDPLKPPYTKIEYEQTKEEICDKINELVREFNKIKKEGKQK